MISTSDQSSSFQQNSTSLGDEVFIGIVDSFTRVVQMFVLGPRLILGLRDYNANLVAKSDEGISMISIAFQGRVHLSTGNGAQPEHIRSYHPSVLLNVYFLEFLHPDIS